MVAIIRSSPFLSRGRGLNEGVVCLMPESQAASNQTGLDDPPVPPSALKDHERHIAPPLFQSSADGFRPPPVPDHRCRSRRRRAVAGWLPAGAGGSAAASSAGDAVRLRRRSSGWRISSRSRAIWRSRAIPTIRRSCRSRCAISPTTSTAISGSSRIRRCGAVRSCFSSSSSTWASCTSSRCGSMWSAADSRPRCRTALTCSTMAPITLATSCRPTLGSPASASITR